MPIIIYLFLLVFLLILLVLFASIVLTLKFNFLDMEEKKEFGGTFTIKWLLFSHTFSFDDLKTQEPFFEEPKKSKAEKEVIMEKEDCQDKKEFEQKRREIGEKTSDENEKISFYESEEKTSLNDKSRGKKRVQKEEKVEPKKGMVITTREKIFWGLKAFRCLRKPLLRLFSDILNGIKIRRLNSRITFGLADPADTGMLCGFIYALTGYIYSRCSYCGFSINPVFTNSMIDFRGDAEIRLKIYSMIFPYIKFIFNRNTISFTYVVIKELVQKKWKSEWGPKWRSKWKSRKTSNS
jgi:hypothetical protein